MSDKITRKDILDQALTCVTGGREEQYGIPEDNFLKIAKFWEVYLTQTCMSTGVNICINPEDVAAMMILLKVARVSSGNAKNDNWVDIAGYAACGGEIQAEEIPKSINIDCQKG